MRDETMSFLSQKTRELIDAPTCCANAKAAAQAWLDAAGSEAFAEQTAAYIAELEEHIQPIDGLIEFADSPKGREYFGAEKAAEIAAHAREIKAAGANYCDCPACAVVGEILDKKSEILA